MAGGLDFGSLPPEVNSGLMYSGAGSGPLIDAANAWAGLASELDSAASACAEVVSGLTSGAWHGRAAASMVAAAAPYAAWMRATAGHAAVAASNAAAAAAAYQRAFAATVPPPVVATNRVQLAALTATNLLGQNAPAIAKVEAAYAVMWAQDATAMYGYAAQSAAAAALNPLTAPPATTTATGLANQSAATAAASSQTTLSQMLSALPNTLQTLAGPSITAPGSDTASTGLAGLLNLLTNSTPTPFGNLINSTLGNTIFAGAPESPTAILQNAGDMGGLAYILARTMSPLTTLQSATALNPIASQATTLAAAPTDLGGLATLTGAGGLAATTGPGGLGNLVGAEASAGKAALIGGLSVPHSWASVAPAPPLRLASAVSGPSVSSPGIGIGPMAMPGTPMPAAVHGGSPRTPRYGFRLTVMAPPPTGK